MANPVGRPPKYPTPELMQEAIDEYFFDKQPSVMKDIDGNVIINGNGKPIIEMNPPTISGLALHLGFVNRQSMYDYENIPEFSDTVKTARLRCENFVETGGMSGNVAPAMAIFALKNYGWRDKTETELYGKDGGSIDTTINIIGIKPKDQPESE
jgi:hypothetical protein